MYPEIYNLSRHPQCRCRAAHPHEDHFTCLHCGALVYTQPLTCGVQNRNHCPYCLSSRHVDHAQAGDRLSACKALMQPIGLTMKPGRNKYACCSVGELMLVHQCGDCGKFSINRIAADDQAERLMALFHASIGLDEPQRSLLIESGIRLLTGDDAGLVERQLFGIARQ